MGTSRKRRRHKLRRARAPKIVLFEKFTVGDVQRWAEAGEVGRRFHWDWYSDLAYQRSQVSDRIRAALLSAAEPFKLEKWQRAARLKYALEPVSPAGSLKGFGSRFNVGAGIDAVRFSPFPALYIAADRETAMQELLGQDAATTGRLSPLELALSRADAVFNVPVSGALRTVIDLRKSEKLDAFVEVIKDFTVAASVTKIATDHGMPPPTLVRSRDALLECMLHPSWRQWPALFGVPSSSQVFGQLVHEAGIEGIVYPSKFNGHANLALFPKNLADGSYIEVDDQLPAETRLRRLDAATAKTYGV